MRKQTKVWLIVATLLVVAGLAMFAVTMFGYGWDFTKLSTQKYETNTYDISDAFQNISVNTDTADISFTASADGTCTVICYEEENAKHSVYVQDGTLVIAVNDTRKWYDNIGINFNAPKITISLPDAEYGKFAVTASTGDISIQNTQVEALDLSVSTGRITVSDVVCQGDLNVTVSTGKTILTDIQCKCVISTGSTGDMILKNVIATEKFSIRRDTGDVHFDKSDAADIFVETDTGDVTGSLLADKVYIVHTDTGKISVPKTTTGGKCEITTDTGDIRITVS